MHTGRVCLHYGRAGININDQAGKVISLAMYQSVSVVSRIFSNTNAATHLIGNTEFAFPKIRINSFILMKRKHAHGDAAYLEMSLGYEFLLGSVDFNYFTFFGFTVEMSDGT